MKAITKEKIGWGFIGTGTIAKSFAACLSLVPDAEIAAIGSRSLDTAQTFAATYGGKPYGSYEAMLSDPNVDVVYVATPHMVHEENVIMAAEHGKAILCEKPFTVNRPSAERMFAAAKAADVFCMEGLWSRFFPAWREARRILESGELGQLVSIDAATCWGASRRPGEGFREGDRRIVPELAGGALLDAGIYVLAAASVAAGGLTKLPKTIFSTMRFEPTGVDSDTDMLLELDGGVTAHLVCSLHRRNHEVHIYCEDGDIYLPSHRNPTSITVNRRLKAENIRYGNETVTKTLGYNLSGFQFEAEVVQNCLRQGLTTCPEVPPEETLTLIGICDEIRQKHGFKYPFE